MNVYSHIQSLKIMFYDDDFKIKNLGQKDILNCMSESLAPMKSMGVLTLNLMEPRFYLRSLKLTKNLEN